MEDADNDVVGGTRCRQCHCCLHFYTQLPQSPGKGWRPQVCFLVLEMPGRERHKLFGILQRSFVGHEPLNHSWLISPIRRECLPGFCRAGIRGCHSWQTANPRGLLTFKLHSRAVSSNNTVVAGCTPATSHFHKCFRNLHRSSATCEEYLKYHTELAKNEDSIYQYLNFDQAC